MIFWLLSFEVDIEKYQNICCIWYLHHILCSCMVLLLCPGNYICSMYILFLYLICIFYCLFDMEDFPMPSSWTTYLLWYNTERLLLFLSMSDFMFSLLLIYGRLTIFCFFFWGVLFFIRQMSCILCHIPCVLYVTGLLFFFELWLILFGISWFIENGYPLLPLLSWQHPQNRNSFHIWGAFYLY